MTHEIRVVQFAPDAWRERAEALAEAAGYGPGCLSVPLLGADGAQWWGCHAWWRQDALEAYTPPTGDDAADEILLHVMTWARIGGDPQEHWRIALAAAGLREAECEE